MFGHFTKINKIALPQQIFIRTLLSALYGAYIYSFERIQKNSKSLRRICSMTFIYRFNFISLDGILADSSMLCLVYLSIFVSIYQSISLVIYLTIYLSFFRSSKTLSISLSILLTICLSIH